MKPKHQRLIFIIISMIFLCVAVLFTLQAFRDNIVFFYSPSDVVKKQPAVGRAMRLGGLVEAGSLRRGEDQYITFTITDGNETIAVDYRGMVPNLFREGQGVVAQGSMTDAMHFHATTILAKHDEAYMPREVVDALKQSGRWKGDEAAAP